MSEVPLRSLSPGSTFMVDLGPHGRLDYRLLYVNDCRAFVEPLGRKVKQVKSNDDLLAEFEVPEGSRGNIAPGTMVTMLEQCNDDLLGDAPVASRARATKAGVISHPPQKAKRPMRPKTTRAKMYEFITDPLIGEPSVKAVMAHFEMKKALVLAHIWTMWRDNGFGYTVDDDKIEITDAL